VKQILILLTLILFLGTSSVKSQDIPPPNPGLVISVVYGQVIQFDFNDIGDYINGIQNSGQSTFIRIGAIYDWKLQFKADQLMFYGTNDASHQMELNNVGVRVESQGTNLDDGSNIINYAKLAPIALESDDVTLMTKGVLSNKGYHYENQFYLNWEMGTRNGNMNQLRMLDQALSPDDYTLTIILTLSVY
jgi:hypothetical protein